MAREPIRSYQNQLMNYGIGRAFADNKPVTRGQMAQAAIPEDPSSLLDNLRRLKMAGGLSRASEIVPRQEFSLPEDIFEATEDVTSTAKGVPSDFVPFQIPEGANVVKGKTVEPGTITQTEGELGSKVIPSKTLGGRGTVIEGMGDRAKFMSQMAADAAIDEKMNKDAIAGLLGDSGSPDKTAAVEDAFMSGIDEMMSVLGREVPKVGDRKELLQKYMQEFSEATGIPVDGKIDKSQALMALGLGLMQNRAGKGFNVGRMLSSVGEAGQAAMPYLTKAKDDAKQARIAAGKYALEKIKSDEDASQAIETSNAALRQELILKNIDAQNDAKMKILEAQLEGKDVSQMPESIYNEEIKIGTNTYKIRMGINPSNLQPVFVNPTMDADEIGTAYSKTISGLNTINEMEQLTNELIDLSRETPAGMTGRRFLDSAKGVLRSMGMSEEDFFRSEEGKGLSAEDELDAIRRAFIMRFKRFISQETGNGISNVDVAQIEAASGALDELLSFKNPEKSLVAFKELRKLFDGSLQSLQPMVTNFTDRDNYYAGEAGDKLYEKTMEKLNQALGGSANFVTPTMVENEDGSQTQTYDVRS